MTATPRASSRGAARRERAAAGAPPGAKPKPELKIVETRVFRGPNYWNYEPGHQARRRPRRARALPDEHDPRLHRGAAPDAARRRPAHLRHGARRRLRRSAARGDVGRPRRRAHRAPAPARGRHRGRSRQDPRHRRAGPVPRRLLVRRGGRRRGGRASSPSASSTTSSRPSATSTSSPSSSGSSSSPSGPPSGPRPRRSSTRPRCATSPHPPQRAVAGPARARRPPEADPRHDDEPHRVARRRHRLGQEAHEPAARRDRRPGAALGGRPRRGWRGGRGGTHRLPGGDEAARRQPRPRGHAQPGRRGCGARRLPGRSRAEPGRRAGGRDVPRRQRLPLPRHRRRPARGGAARAGPRRGRREAHGHRARRDHQRGSAPRHRPREGADPHQDRRRGDRVRPRAGLRAGRRARRAGSGSTSSAPGT